MVQKIRRKLFGRHRLCETPYLDGQVSRELIAEPIFAMISWMPCWIRFATQPDYPQKCQTGV
jgi:hypothetical protein